MVEALFSERGADVDSGRCRIAQDVITNAREVLAITKRGVRIIFPNMNAIHKILCEQINTRTSNEN